VIITAINCWENAKIEHQAYFNRTVKANLAKYKRRVTVRIFNYLTAEHSAIRDGNEIEFRRVQAGLDVILKTLTLTTQTRVLRCLRIIYDYNNFSRKKNKAWDAYKLCEKLSVVTCPYCNLAYGHTLIIGSDGIFRPTLDHFFDKANYPIFSLSLGNLVASCHHCNSSLKGSKDFLHTPHLNPLTTAESIQITLDVDPISSRADLRLFDSAKIKMVFNKKDQRSKNSIKTFYLQERYQLLIEEARSIAKHMEEFSQSYPKENSRREWILRGISSQNYRNRVLGKLIFDFSTAYLRAT
jgi:hypothetical protein